MITSIRFNVLILCAAIFSGLGVFANNLSLTEQPDKKTAVMTVLGIRNARASGNKQIKIEIGASTSDANRNPLSYRIVSEDDPNYAYSKFITPLKASAISAIELQPPPGFDPGKGGFAGPFTKTEVTLDLPTPLKDGKTYSVVGIGVDGRMVTAARTAASFCYGAPVAPPPAVMTVMGLRGISSIGNGILMLEFGPAFSEKDGSITRNYNLTVNDVRHPVLNLGRRSRIDVYRPEGWPFKGIREHRIFLDSGVVLKDGDKVKVKVSSNVTSGANSVEFVFNHTNSFSPSIKVNQVGYQTNSPIKRAMLGYWLGSFPENNTNDGIMNPDAFFSSEQPKMITPSLAPYALSLDKPPEFFIYDAVSRAKVYQGLSRFVHNGLQSDGKISHASENVYELNFTDFKTPGQYFIAIPGVGRSFGFKIADDVYREAFEKQAYGVFVQRSGIELQPPFSQWRRVASLDKGIVVTTEKRFEHEKWGNFKDNQVMIPNPDAGGSDKLKKLRNDGSMIAEFIFNGNINNSVVNGAQPLPLASSFRFRDDHVIRTSGKVLESNPDGRNGFKLATNIDFKNGAAVSFQFRKDPATGSRFDGTLFTIGGIGISANWGLFSFRQDRQLSAWQRIKDNEWHHFFINIVSQENGSWQSTFYVDGIRLAEFTRSQPPNGEVIFANISNLQCGGALLGNLMIFKRSLNEQEMALTGECNPAEIPLKLNASGGHHDAGDYNPRSHIDVAQILMDAYEMTPRKYYDGQLNIPEKNNGIPDIVDEALWALKLWIGLQDPADGGVYNGTESQGDPNFIQTVELDDTGDYAWAKDSQGSLLFAGAMAQASRILKKHGKMTEAEDYLQRAVRAYQWGCANPVPVNDQKIYGEFYLAPKAYAAAELLHTTGEQQYRIDFRENSPWSRDPTADIAIYGKYDFTLAACSYATVPKHLADADIQKATIKAICREADMYINGSRKMAYKFIRHPYAPIGWGNGTYAQFLTIVRHAWAITREPEYYRWIVKSCDNTLGCNPLNLSWVVGLGTRTIRAPLHNSRYNPTGMVVDGQQAEGPHSKGKAYNYQETVYPPHSNQFAVMYAFVDSHFAIAMDEGMVNRQAETMASFGILLPDHVDAQK